MIGSKSISLYRFASLCFFTALFSSAQALAAEPLSSEALMNLPLESLLNIEVTGVSKYAQKESEAPAAVEVVTADDIRTNGYRTLGDAINGLHGLYVSTDGEYDYLGQHTKDNSSRYLVMVDGRRMNDNMFDEVDTGHLFMLDMALVDRIEFIPGPGSSIYGGNAMMGVINVVSKKGSDINGTQVEGDLASAGTTGGRMTYGKTLSNGANVLLSASTYNSDGPANIYYPVFDQRINPPGAGNGFEPSNDGFAHDMDGEHAKHMFANVRYQDFTFTGGYVSRFKQVPTDPNGDIFNDPGWFAYDSEYYTEVKYNKALSDKTQLDVEAFDQWYAYHAEQAFDANAGVGPLARNVDYDQANGNWWGGQAQLVTTAFDRQKLVTGVDFQFDQKQFQQNYDMAPNYAVFLAPSTLDGVRAGVFAQDDITLAKNWILSAGGRFDDSHMMQRIQFNPRLGLVWDQTPENTVKLLYGSAFRAPNVGERYPGDGPEHVRNYQLVDEWRPNRDLKLTGSLFINNYTEVLQQDPATSVFSNSARYNSYGYDVGVEKHWYSGRSLKVSFDHTIMRDVTDIWAIDSPKNVSKVQFGQPLFNNYARLGIENVFIGARRTEQEGMPNAAAYDLVNTNITSDRIFPGAEGFIICLRPAQ